MKNQNKFILLTITALICLTPRISLANATNNLKPVPLIVKSDYSDINYHTGINHYIGHVVATHGKSKMTGNKITTYRSKANKINKIVTTGKPATFYSNESSGKPQVYAKALTITYYPLKHLAVFQKKAYANQGKTILRAPLINYNTKTQVLQSGGNKSEQAHIFLTDTHSQQGNS